MCPPSETRSRARNRKHISGTFMNEKNAYNEEDILKISTGTKKIRLTKDEKKLSGAPEGDIFDITIFADENLDHLQRPSLEWTSAISVLSSESTSWADKHSSIVIIRKLSLHHQEVLDDERFGVALTEATRATGSLRSCICRNGILCLQSLYRLPFFSKWAGGPFVDVYAESITTLMYKSVNAPRFICASAVAALEVAVEKTPIALMQSILQEPSQHKNASISNRAFLLVSEQVLRSRPLLRDQSNDGLATLLLFLESGLSGPRPAGREASKKALKLTVCTVEMNRIQFIIDNLIPDDKKFPLSRSVAQVQLERATTHSAGSLTVRTSRPVVNLPKPEGNKFPKSVGPRSFRDQIKMWKTQRQEHKVGPRTDSAHSDLISLDSLQLTI